MVAGGHPSIRLRSILGAARLGAALSLFMVAPSAHPAAAATALSGITPGEILVLGAPRMGKAGAASPAAGALALAELTRAKGFAVRAVEPVSASPAAFPDGAWVVRLADDAAFAEALAALAADPAVAYAGPNHIVPLTQTGGDPELGAQDGLARVRAPEAWARTEGAGVLVAVIDSGVELDHPDLADRIAVNAVEAAGVPGVDDDGNGYADDVHGYDFTDAPEIPGVGDYTGRDPDPSDDFGHGTSAAGVIAASRGNGIGIVGVAPRAEILVVRAGLRTSVPLLPAVLQEDDAAAAIVYAADRGAHVINLSWGDEVDAPVIREAVRYARARGALVVASAGNEGADIAFYPAGYPGVLSIGATATDDERAGFSVFGDDLDLLAPGLSVLATALGGGTARVSGTSFSAPFVAGAAALVWSLHPEWTADQVAWRLRRSARGSDAGWSPDAGWGRLDAAAAVRDADAGAPPVLGLESLARIGGDRWEIAGTVSAPSLVDWELAVESADRETTLVRDDRQAVGAVLAAWDAGGWPAGESTVRLRARAGGMPVLEDRVRFRPRGGSAPAPVEDLRVEVQAGGENGWGILARWRTAEPTQGRLALHDGSDARLADDVGVRESHVLRIDGPLPPGIHDLEILARADRAPRWTSAARTAVAVPPSPAPLPLEPAGATPPGTPFFRTLDWDGDFRPEVLVERPPRSGFYGELAAFERSDEGEWVAYPDPGSPLTGIPIDEADVDGDGRRELLVFRVADWNVREARNPGEFPVQLRLSVNGDDSVPVGFLRGGALPGLASIRGATLSVHRADDREYTLAGTATNRVEGMPRLLVGGAIGDFDADGELDVALADESGALVRFAVGADGPRWLAAHAAPEQLLGPMLARPHGAGHELWTVESPRRRIGENPFDLASIVVRRWVDVGQGLVPGSAVSFAGGGATSRIRLLSTDDGALLFREGRVDAIALDPETGALSWEGSILRESGRDAMVRVPGADGSDLYWLGQAIGTEGVAWRAPADPAPRRLGSELRVERAEVDGESLRVTLTWRDGECAADVSLLRVEEGGTRTVTVGAPGRAEDAAPLGSAAEYVLRRGNCADSRLGIVFLPPSTPTPRWVGAHTIELAPARPLAHDAALPRAAVRDASGAEWEASAIQILAEGRRVVIEFSSLPEAADSLIVWDAVDAAAIPLGGARRWAGALSPRPSGAAAPVLARARYEVRGGVPGLLVTLGGSAVVTDCERPLRVEPADWDVPLPENGAEGFVPLPEPLGRGVYTVRFDDACVAAPAGSLGREIRFTVGILAYPNPVRPGDRLTVSGLLPGSAVALCDVRGEPLRVWDAPGASLAADLSGLASGVYLLRVREPGGRWADASRVALLR